MCRFIETVRVEDGCPIRLDCHLERVAHTRRQWFGSDTPVDADLLRHVAGKTRGVAKLRFVYDEHRVYDLSCAPYTPRRVTSLQMVTADEAEYGLKREDRRMLETIRTRRGACDEVLIVKDGCLTDTSYTNIALWDGHRWVSPDTPLLPGTRRRRLIDSGRLIEARVAVDDLRRYTHIAMVNAMIDLGDLVIPMTHVMLPADDRCRPEVTMPGDR